MKASDFVKQYGSLGPTAWERAAYELARSDSFIEWPLVPVPVSNGKHSLVIQVAADYFTLGEQGDTLRMPLTMPVAQAICTDFNMLLPTYKLVVEIHRAATVKPAPIPSWPNQGAAMAQYVSHDAQVNAAIAALGKPVGLTSGPGKDYVISNAWKPGHCVIYGWCKDPIPPGNDPYPYMVGGVVNWRLQPLMPGHAAEWVDYSQLVRFISNTATLDGQSVRLEDVYTSADPTVNSLVSAEGQLKFARVPVPGQLPAAQVPYTPLSLTDLARERVRYLSGTSKKT